MNEKYHIKDALLSQLIKLIKLTQSGQTRERIVVPVRAFLCGLIGLATVALTMPSLSYAQQTEADVILVIDSSNSMEDEAQAIQNELNNFASIIQSQFIDLHLILITEDEIQGGICVPAPLGSAICPLDENLPGFRHVVQQVVSSGAFNTVLSSYFEWVGSLRPGATKTIIVVSDDNDEMTAGTFKSGLLNLDPTFNNFRFHGIVADYVIPYSPCIAIAENPGTEYLALINDTGGVLNNLCDQNIKPGLEDIAEAVIVDTGPGTPGTPPSSFGRDIFSLRAKETKNNGVTVILKMSLAKADTKGTYTGHVSLTGGSLLVQESCTVSTVSQSDPPFFENSSPGVSLFRCEIDELKKRVNVIYKAFNQPKNVVYNGAGEIRRDAQVVVSGAGTIQLNE